MLQVKTWPCLPPLPLSHPPAQHPSHWFPPTWSCPVTTSGIWLSLQTPRRSTLWLLSMRSLPRPLHQRLGLYKVWKCFGERCLNQTNRLLILAFCDLDAMKSEEILVPDKMVGLIIGRGGSVISSLQEEIGAKIQMAPDSLGLPDRREYLLQWNEVNLEN